MRIYSQAPGRRVHSRLRREGHVRYRRTTTSARHLRLRYGIDGLQKSLFILVY